MGNSSDAAEVSVQADGSVVVAGTAEEGGVTRFMAARYGPNGRVDPAFGGGGVVVTDVGDPTQVAVAQAVAVQPDGKIVVVGSAFENGELGFVLVRYSPDGTLDSTFGNAGKVRTEVPGGASQAFDVVLQPDGKIVVAGGSVSEPSTDGRRFGGFALARYNPDGSLDQTFGDASVSGVAGISIVRVGEGGDATAVELVLQPDGKFVAVGTALGTGTERRFATARLNADGTLDPTFGNAGTVTVPGSGSAFDVLVQPDGKIVAVGLGSAGGRRGGMMIRYNTDGTLDPTFGTNGTAIDETGAGTAAALQVDGGIVVNRSLGVVRYQPDGSRDESFGNGGEAALAQGVARDVAAQGQTVVVAGAVRRPSGQTVLTVGRLLTEQGTQLGRRARLITRIGPVSFHALGGSRALPGSVSLRTRRAKVATVACRDGSSGSCLVQVRWRTRTRARTGRVISMGRSRLSIEPGRTRSLTFRVPRTVRLPRFGGTLRTSATVSVRVAGRPGARMVKRTFKLRIRR